MTAAAIKATFADWRTASKSCSLCGIVQPLTAFYKHKRSADGTVNQCKKCLCSKQQERRRSNGDAIRERDRARANRPDRVMANTARTKLWRRSDPRKARAHTAVQLALKAGALIRQDCEKCGAGEQVHAHHDDYGKPLEVIWLCPKCHSRHHAQQRSEQHSLTGEPFRAERFSS